MLIILSLTLKMTQVCIVAKVTSGLLADGNESDEWLEKTINHIVLLSFMVLLAIVDFITLGFALCIHATVCVCVWCTHW